MCGLVGAFSLVGQRLEADRLRLMTDVQKHRGPDDQGLRAFSLSKGTSEEIRGDEGLLNFDGGVGFNRLSILDLSPNGHQPMVSRDGMVFIAFNGEVYNAFDHVEDLKSKGFTFRSHSDTEVLLYLYEAYGIEGMLPKLNGMFAFTVVDLRRREIHVLRDHLGIKPMYYTRAGEWLVWGSEIKSLLTWPGVTREVCPESLDEQLLFRYTAGDKTPYKDIFQLRPGYRMVITPSGSRVIRYWEIPDVAAKQMSVKEAREAIAAKLEESVKSQLISDVKLGCQLSGGVDSSLVTAMARDRFGADLESFSITFAESHVSEEKWIREAATKTQTQCHLFPLTFDYFFQNLRRATWHMDYPLNLANGVGLFLLAQEAKKRVTVLLSGDGADEIFGGYPRFYFGTTRNRVQPMLGLLERLPKLGPKFTRNYNLPAGLEFAPWFVNYSASMRISQLQELRPGVNWEKVLAPRIAMFEEGKGDQLSKCLKYEAQTFMVELLIRQDKMMMAHSVENRVPMLDRELVEVSRSLPREALVDSHLFRRQAVERGTKVALKQLAAARFGEPFAYRFKEGFGLPLFDYFRRSEFEALLRDDLLPSLKSRGWMDAGTISRWHERLVAGDHTVTEAMWTVVSTEVWAQACLDGVPSQGLISRGAAVVTDA